MKILFIGDIVGECGKKMAFKSLRQLKQSESFDLVIANGENIAERNGITEELYREMIMSGIDVVTLGNHTWDRWEVYHFIDEAEALVRPANFPVGTPGKGYTIFDLGRRQVAVISLMGNVFISTLPSPFMMVQELIEEIKGQGCQHIIIDFHGEATSEKIAFGFFVDGQVGAVIGTHTHVQTADEKVLAQGTAYITDAGMTGAYTSVLGVKPDLSVQRFVTQRPVRFEQADGRAQFNAVIMTLNDDTGLAEEIRRIHIVE